MEKRNQILTIVGTIIGIISGTIAIYQFVASDPSSSKSTAPKQASKPEASERSSSFPPTLLSKIGPGTSLRYVESLLGVPVSESETYKTFESGGYKFSVHLGGQSVHKLSVGPMYGAKASTLEPLRLQGDWGSINSQFGEATFGDFIDRFPCHLSHWNWGGNMECIQDLTLSCGGSHANSYLVVKPSISAPGCYSQEFTQPIFPGDLGLPYDFDLTDAERMVDLNDLRSYKINNLTVAPSE